MASSLNMVYSLTRYRILRDLIQLLFLRLCYFPDTVSSGGSGKAPQLTEQSLRLSMMLGSQGFQVVLWSKLNSTRTASSRQLALRSYIYGSLLFKLFFFFERIFWVSHFLKKDTECMNGTLLPCFSLDVG